MVGIGKPEIFMEKESMGTHKKKNSKPKYLVSVNSTSLFIDMEDFFNIRFIYVTSLSITQELLSR
jgi:hypothetical protein